MRHLHVATGSRILLAITILLFQADLGAGQVPAGGSVTGTIRGTTVSMETSEPISAVAVAIRRLSDSTVVATVLTNASGRFERAGLPFGNYDVEVASVGYEPVVRDGVRLTGTAPLHDLGTIPMAMAVVRLDGVMVEGQRSAVVLATDRSIYNIRDMPVVQGGFATDALRAIPELEVDVDDNIRARGGEPLILLDGRPLPMQGADRTAFLRSLRADRIDRIEYIPNPSARFEAEGQSGVVNIVLRRDTGLGLSGALSANTGTRGTQNLSTRLNYQRGAVTFFGGGLLGLSQSNISSFDQRRHLATTPISHLRQRTDRELDTHNGGADLTTEVKLSPRVTGWTIVRGSWGGSDEFSLAEFTHLDQNEAATDRYERENVSDNGRDSFSGAVGVRRVIDTQRDEFSAEIRYNVNASGADTENARYLLPLEGERLEDPPELTRVDTDTRDAVLAVQADLSKPLGPEGRVDLGYRGNFRTNRQVQDLTRFDRGAAAPAVDEMDGFRYAEDSHAAYLNVDRTVGRFGLQGGLRFESVDGTIRATSLAQEVSSRDSGLFPSANVAYDLGEGRQLRFSYSKRIQRPNAGLLNPIDSNPADPFNLNVGNPHLGPADIHSFGLDGSWTGRVGTLRLSPLFLRGTNLWDRIATVDAEGVSTAMSRNVSSARAYGFSANGSFREIVPLSGFVALNVQHLEYDAGNLPGIFSGAMTSWNTSANVTTTVTPTLRVQTTANYSPGAISPQGRVSAFKQVNVAVTQRLLDNRGVLTLSLVDPFDLSRRVITSLDATQEQTVRTSNRIRRATLSISYNFGRPPQSNRRVVQDEPTGGGGLSGGDTP